MTNIALAELGNAGITIGRTKSLNNLTIIGFAPDAKMNDAFSHLNDY